MLLESAVEPLKWAVTESAGSSSFTLSYQLSYSLMLLLVERASQLQPMKAPDIASTLCQQHGGAQSRPAMPIDTFVQALEDNQVKLLRDAELAGQQAVHLFAKQQQQVAGDSSGGLAGVHSLHNDTIDNIKKLMQELPGIKSELLFGVNALEMAKVLTALMQVSRGNVVHMLPKTVRHVVCACLTSTGRKS